MGPKRKKKRAISFQGRRLMREILSGKHRTISSAGEAAGYSGTAAHRALKNLQGTMSEIMDQVGITDAYLVQNCLGPLLHATQTKHFQHKGKIKDTAEVADTDARIRALDIALRVKGKYAPIATETPHKNTVKVLILDCPRPKRDIPAPTVIELAQRGVGSNVLPQPDGKRREAPINVLPASNVLPRNGNGSDGGRS
jgi:hypothetical protein